MLIAHNSYWYQINIFVNKMWKSIMEKIIDVDNNCKIKICVSGELIETTSISKMYIAKDEIKIIDLSIWDDFSFSGYTKDAMIVDKISFDFNINDPIYFALNRLLGTDSSLLIDDDNTYDTFQKYMEIERKDNFIKITFYNNAKSKDEYNYKRFRVFIKNIGLDGRSKITDNNIKIRLVRFFREAKEILLNENHQYTFDECYEILKSNDYYKEENPFLKNIFKKFRNNGENCHNCSFGCDSDDKVMKEIEECEVGIKKENNFWCDKYLPNEEYKQFRKKL